MISNDSDESQDLEKEICDKNIILTPKNYIGLEYLFTRYYQTNILDQKEEKYIRKFQETHKINIGTPYFPKYINLGISCTTEEIDQHTQLFK
jgi:hypothetical protein